MSSSVRFCHAISLLLALSLIAAHPAPADTYKVTIVDFTDSENFGGIDDKGDFFINDNLDNARKCGEQSGDPCFELFLVGQAPVFTTTRPILQEDNGASCTITLNPIFAPQTTASGICNNGHEIFWASTSGGPRVFDGPDLSDQFFVGTFDGGLINANGDAVFIDGVADELIFAQDLTTATPEPDSLLLLGTGCLSLLGSFRRSRHS